MSESQISSNIVHTNLQERWKSIKYCSFPKVEGHHLPIDDLVAGVTIGGVNPWVFARGLGQSLFKPLLKCVRHVINEFLVGLLQFLDLGVLGGQLLVQEFFLHLKLVHFSLKLAIFSLEKVESFDLRS